MLEYLDRCINVNMHIMRTIPTIVFCYSLLSFFLPSYQHQVFFGEKNYHMCTLIRYGSRTTIS
jgi:hypothetical protein